MNQGWETVISPKWIADGPPLASSVTLTDISPTPNTNVAASFLELGSLLHVRAQGRFSTTGTPTLLIGAYWGGVAGTALATTGALTTTTGAANLTWLFDCYISVRSTGTTGTAMTNGFAAGITGATAVALVPASAPVVATIDTTAAKVLTVGAQWGTSSASNTITCHTCVVESIN